MRPESWITRVLLTIARSTPDYRRANLDWRWNLQTDRTGNIFRRWLGAIIAALTAGVLALSVGGVALYQATGYPSPNRTPTAPTSVVTGTPPTTHVPIPESAPPGVPVGSGGFSSLLILMGAILVLLGVSAIALILRRRSARWQHKTADQQGHTLTSSGPKGPG